MFSTKTFYQSQAFVISVIHLKILSLTDEIDVLMGNVLTVQACEPEFESPEPLNVWFSNTI